MTDGQGQAVWKITTILKDASHFLADNNGFLSLATAFFFLLATLNLVCPRFYCSPTQTLTSPVRVRVEWLIYICVQICEYNLIYTYSKCISMDYAPLKASKNKMHYTEMQIYFLYHLSSVYLLVDFTPLATWPSNLSHRDRNVILYLFANYKQAY